MELFAITLHGCSEAAFEGCRRSLSRAFKGLHPKGGTVLRWDVDANRRIIRCLHDSQYPPGTARLTELVRKTAEAAAGFIVLELQFELVRELARKQADGDEEDGAAVDIEAYSLRLLDAAREPKHQERRLRRLADELTRCLHEHGTVDIWGFVTFRAASYREELREAVADAAGEYRADRQYREFVHVLRLVVDTQEPGQPIVHLIHRPAGDFLLLDGRFRALQRHDAAGGARPIRLLREEGEASEPEAEDRIVSALIAASPRRIVIHTQESEHAAVRTIRSVYAERVRLCEGCAACAAEREGAALTQEGGGPDRRLT